jgi:hypothetical protein
MQFTFRFDILLPVELKDAAIADAVSRGQRCQIVWAALLLCLNDAGRGHPQALPDSRSDSGTPADAQNAPVALWIHEMWLD